MQTDTHTHLGYTQTDRLDRRQVSKNSAYSLWIVSNALMIITRTILTVRTSWLRAIVRVHPKTEQAI